jgi:hypothetical protein
LILVHPDYAREVTNPRYVGSLKAAIARALANRVPVFLLASEPIPTTNYALRSWLEGHGLHTLPDHGALHPHVHLRWRRRRAQRDVDDIAARIGKRPGEIRLAFGGMYREACVLFTADTLCRTVNTRRRSYLSFDGETLPRHPFARGEIVGEISA